MVWTDAWRHTLRALLLLLSGLLLPKPAGATPPQHFTAFPGTTLGSTSASTSVPVTLPQGGTVASVRVLILGGAGLDYRAAGSDACTGNSFTSGQSCSVAVTFSPLYAGTRAGAVVLLDASSNPLGTQLLTGLGVGAQAVFVPGTIQTIAGDGNFTSIKDNGPATSADLYLPFGVVVDGKGNVFIADSDHNRIRRVDAQTQTITTIAGTSAQGYAGDGGPASQATLGTPRGMAIDGAGNLFFADNSNSVIRRIDGASGIITTVAGTGANGYSGDGGQASAALLDTPYGVTLDPAGNLYIADTVNNVIRRVDGLSAVITTVAGGGVGGPTQGDGGAATAATLNQPYGVAFDASGNMFIPDAGDNRIRRVDALSGVISNYAGTGTQGFAGDGGAATSAELYAPAALAFDPGGNLYIADTQNYRVRKVVNGNIGTVAGSGADKFGGDAGPATLAGVYAPFGLFLDGPGNLYIADYFDQRIRKIASNLVMLTYPTAIRVGQTSPPQSQGIENDGNASLTFSSITPDANAAVDAGSTSCSTGAALAIGHLCSIGAEFAPTQVGNPIAGNITASGNAGDSPLTLVVVGDALALNSTSVSLVSSLNPSTYGQSVNFIATVTSGTGTPTGAVTFKDGTQTLGSGTLNSFGAASFALTSLAPGSHAITAVYAGDSAHGGSTSPGLNQVVQSATATTLTSSANPAPVKSTLTLTAHVAQTSGAPPSSATSPTGTVVFYDGSSAIGTAAVDGSGNAALATAALAVGTHSITAHYPGDSYNLQSTSGALSQVLTQQATSTALTASSNPAVYGNSVLYTATVTVTGTGPATGSVNFFDGSTQIASSALNGSGVASFSSSTLTAGAHSLTAHYLSDTNDSASTSAPLTETIQQAQTSNTVTYSPNPAIAGKPTTLIATLADTTGGGTPQGSIAFHDGSTSLGAGTVNGSGQASVSATLSPGPHTITSSYGGDTNHAGSNGTLSLTVQQASTTTTLSATPNPSTLGATVAFSIHVQGNGGTPGGTVTLTADGNPFGTATLSGGNATISNATLTVGTHQMAATYGGDTNDTGSSTTQAYTQTVNRATASLAVAGAPNPVVSGDTVTFTATLAYPTGDLAPTGSVQFSQGSTVLGTGTLNSAGMASYATSSLSPGVQTITASYAGDGNYLAASATTQENVQRATTATLTANVNPAVAGTPVAFAVQVNGSGTTPTGNVTLLDGSTIVAILALNSSGTATYTTSALVPGSHSLTAHYAGDQSHGAAVSSTLVEIVQQATTTTSVAASVNPSIAGKALVLTATVTGNGGTPGGTVQFFNGTQVLGTVALGSNGHASLSTTALAPGSHSLTATYGGDANDGGSSSAPLAASVVQATTSLVLASTPDPAVVTHAVQLTATVSGNGGTPGGSVSFASGSTVLGTATLNSAGVVGVTVSSLPVGADALTATYAGDTNDTGSQGSFTETVTQAQPMLVLSGSSNPVAQGAPLTFTASMTGAAAGATGTVTFEDSGVSIGTATLMSTGAATGSATLTSSALAKGTHTIQAIYSGDADDAAATSPTLTETVQQSTTTLLSASANPVYTGAPVTFTAVVTAGDGSAPSGSVVFKDGAIALGSVTLAGGQATLQTSTLAPGTHSLTAVYSGDSVDRASTSAAVAEVVQSAVTTVTLTTSGSPSAYGAAVTFTAVVNGSGAPPQGTVTFMDGGAGIGVISIGTTGQAVLSTSSLAPGAHAMEAIYSGDSDDLASRSPVLTEVVLAPTATVLTASPVSIVATGTVVLSAQVRSTAGGTHPGGMVSFHDGAAVLGAAKLDANGVAALSLSTLAAGSHFLTAVYGGDALDSPSTSAAVTETVQAIPTSTHLAASATSLVAGQPLTLLAVVSSGSGAAITGTVNFTSGGNSLGSALLDGTGTASLKPDLPAGTYTVVASYSGDAYNGPSSSPAVTITIAANADFSMTLDRTALSMATKQNATVQLTLASLQGFADQVGLGCAGLPRLVTCTFTKSSVSLAAKGQATVSITVDTASPLTSGGVARNTMPGERPRILLGWLTPGAALLGWIFCRRRPRYARFLLWLLAASVSGSTLLLSGCNGLSSNGAAPGKYVIQVTGTAISTGVMHTVDLSLNVTQ